MYLSLSGGRYIRKKRIIGIFDMDTATICAATKQFLVKNEKEGRMSFADADIPKSFLLIDGEKEKDGCEVLLSKLSSGVLYERTAEKHDIE